MSPYIFKKKRKDEKEIVRYFCDFWKHTYFSDKKAPFRINKLKNVYQTILNSCLYFSSHEPKANKVVDPASVRVFTFKVLIPIRPVGLWQSNLIYWGMERQQIFDKDRIKTLDSMATELH